jgi:bile acid-coenzyme A ligase
MRMTEKAVRATILEATALPDSVIPLGMLPTLHAARDARRPALSFEGRSITRGEFEANANRRARALAAMGVGADDFVTLALPNSIEFYETVFAIWKLGATPNPVSARLPLPEFAAIVDLIDPRLVIGTVPGQMPGRKILPAGTPVDESLSPEPLTPVIPKYWRALTSGGSTGRPKVIVDHNPGVWVPDMALANQKVGDTILNLGPLYHAAPFGMSAIALFTGGHVVESGKFDALRTLELIERYKVGWVNFVPTMMHRIWRLPEEQRNAFDLSSLHTVFHMSANCPAWLKEKWIEWLGPDRIFELYGGTEGAGHTSITGREWLEHKGSVGKPALGSQMKLFNKQGQECAAHEIGEIYFIPPSGANSTYHYIGAEAKSLGDWQTYGDLGHLDEDGYLYLADRRTDMIISGGANIYPAEIEAAMSEHPSVASCVVVGLPDDDLGQIAHAVVECSEEPAARPTMEEMQAFLTGRLVRYKIPRSFEFVDTPLRDEWGKVRRSALRDARISG